MIVPFVEQGGVVSAGADQERQNLRGHVTVLPRLLEVPADYCPPPLTDIPK